MPHREQNIYSCCALIDGNGKKGAHLARLREACGLSIAEAAQIYSLPVMQYIKIERGELGFYDWYRAMEIMCVKANKPFELI